MLSTSNAASISDLRLIARRRLPQFAFDFIDGGAEDEINLRNNTTAFQQLELVPRYLAGVSDPKIETEIFGKSYSAPFGISPMGFLNMAWPGADLAVARLAAQQNIPYMVSSASSTSLEKLAQAANGNAWFQIYLSAMQGLDDELMARARSAGYEVLVVTVDVPRSGKRDRDVRNGLKIPFRPTPRIIADLFLHPRWSLETLRYGVPGYGNFGKTLTGKMGTLSLSEIQGTLFSQNLDWDDLRRLRDKWHGPLLIKGILHPEDASRSIDAGCDAIVVSNHGGRQADYAPASIDALPAIASITNSKIPLLLDSGVRRGADIVRAKALGASLAFAGRAFAYGVAARGTAGARISFDILQSELLSALGQLGIQDFNSVNGNILVQSTKNQKSARSQSKK